MPGKNRFGVSVLSYLYVYSKQVYFNSIKDSEQMESIFETGFIRTGPPHATFVRHVCMYAVSMK
jgi:hypothetical protein